MLIKKEKTQLKVEFEGDIINKVNILKKYYGVQSGAELVRILVNEKAQQLDIGRTEAETDAPQNKKRPTN